MSADPVKRGVTNTGGRVHAWDGKHLPAAAACGVSVYEPYPFRHASGEDRWEFWGADPDACRRCVTALRRASRDAA